MARASYAGDPWAEAVKCLVCEVLFNDRDLYREHTKSGWHKENSNRKMMGDKLLSEEEWVKQFGPKDPPRVEEVVPQVVAPQAEETEQKDEDVEQLQESVDTRPPLADDEIDVCIIFDYKGERWNKTFRTVKGRTLLDLKRLMIKSESPEDDVISFDLQKRRVRVNNYETIDTTDTFEFNYIGPEEGLKKKEKDKDLKAQRDEQARQFRLREEMRQKERGDHDAMQESEAKAEAVRKAAAEAAERKRREEREAEEKRKNERERKSDTSSKDALEFDPPCDESGPAVVIYIHHLEADPLKGKTLSVTVPRTVSVRYLRRAICNKIGRRKIADVTIHRKGHTYSQWPLMEDSELIGSTREFFSRGADLIPAAVPLAVEAARSSSDNAAVPSVQPGSMAPLKRIPGGLDFVVTHDTAEDILEVSIAKGKTVLDLKRAICERVKRGPYTKIVLADSKGNPLAESLALDKVTPEERKTIRLAGLDVCPPFQIDLRVSHATQTGKLINVLVEDTATVLEIKQAVLAKHKRFKLADLKIVSVQKAGVAPAPMPDSMRLNGKREVHALGPLMDSLATG